MKQWILKSPAVLLIAAFVYTSAYATSVEEVLATSDGRTIHENLMALGVEAVPDLCEVLYTHPFPRTIVRALHELGDPRAVDCLDAFLAFQITERAEGRGGLVWWVPVIQALRDLGDASQVPRMEAIFRNEDISFNTRMQAVATICHYSDGSLRDEAEAFIFDMLERYPEWHRRRNIESMGVTDDDLLEALWFVGTEESHRVIVEQLSRPLSMYTDQKAIPYVGKMDRLDAAEALAVMAKDPRQEPHVRVLAAEALRRSPRFEESGAELRMLLADHKDWAYWLDGVEDYPERLQSLLE